MCKFRDLRADEIECRVQSVKFIPDHPERSGVVLLLYKDARVDMNILDEAVGAANWQREHYECKGNLFCRVGIYIAPETPYVTDYNTALQGGAIIEPTKKASGWVWKSDCGTESNTEAQKGEASDSFKRACFNWGIGRELYTAPFTWVSADNCNIKEQKDQRGQVKYACYDNFIVDSITIENKQIVGLKIFNKTKNCIAFTFGKDTKPTTSNAPKEPMTYEKALAYVYKEGKYPDKTLAEIYKTDIAYINELGTSKDTPQEVITALCIINEEIKKAKANKQ